MTSMHNKYFRMRQQLRYVVLVSSLVTSSCMLQSLIANRTTYFVDFRGQTSDGKCFDNFDIRYAAGARVQQYTLLQGIVHPQPRWTETSQQQWFQKWIQDISAYEVIHPVIDDALKVSTAINNSCVDRYNNIFYFRFVHIILGQKYVR